MDSKGFESDYKRHRFSAHLEGMVAASAAGFFSFWAGCTCFERSCLERAAFAPLRHHLPVNARSCAAFAPLRRHLPVDARSSAAFAPPCTSVVDCTTEWASMCGGSKWTRVRRTPPSRQRSCKMSCEESVSTVA